LLGVRWVIRLSVGRVIKSRPGADNTRSRRLTKTVR
jgi:hypothetical protein